MAAGATKSTQLTVADVYGVLARGEAGRTIAWAVPVSRVVIDSRQCTRGSVFVALRGEQADGHQYVGDAFGRGAVCAIVDRPPDQFGFVPDAVSPSAVVVDLRSMRTPDGASGTPGKASAYATEVHPERGPAQPVCLIVADALGALQRLAAWWRARFSVRVIGITGSVGKTTTKEFVASVLSQRYQVLKSEGNYNNEIGLPLTLLELRDDHERVVLEMGTYGPGEIALLSRIARPHVGIVTNVGPVHLERMGTIERIVEAKAELPHSLPSDGVAILNADDARVRSMAEVTSASVFLYGLTPDCDLWADEIESQGLDGVRFRLHYTLGAAGGDRPWQRAGGSTELVAGMLRPADKLRPAKEEVVHVHIPLLGRHSVHTALRAAAAGLVEGLSWDEILHGLRTGEQLRLLSVPGINGSTLLDDTYNSSPDSAIAALNLLHELGGRRVAVLGDMLELGVYAVEGHRRVARRTVDVVSVLITVGELGRLIGQEAVEFGMPSECVFHAEDNRAAIAYLQDLVQKGDTVLIKGSRGMAMEQIVEALARPADTLPSLATPSGDGFKGPESDLHPTELGQDGQ
jgi:UDP-N-acetylmuramoyl-tripeptide--D-alanyl-D-alanine ligase